MIFLSPWWLLLLLPVALLAVGYLVQQRRRSRYAVRFAALPMLERLIPRRPGWRRHAPPTLLLLTFGLLGLAAARPEVEMPVPREEATVVVVVDASLSMRATDVEPNRLDAATAAAGEFISGLPEGFEVSVVAFSGRPQVLAPPTTDHAAAARTLESIELQARTAIGEAVFGSLDVVARHERATGEPDVPARVVLLSDGANTAGRTPAEAAVAAEAAGVPVSTIAYGTDMGEITSGSTTVGTPVDTVTLASLAEESGGAAYTAETGDELSAVYDDINTSLGYRVEPREVAPYLTAGALLLGLAAGGLSLRWFSRLP